MPPPMMSASTLPIRLWMTPILSLTLAPPRIATNGFRGMLQSLAEILEFLFHQQAGRGLRDEMGDAFGGSVRAMRGTERVVHIDVAELRELLRELRIVGLFFRHGSEGSRAAGSVPSRAWRASSSRSTPTQSGEKPTLHCMRHLFIEQDAQAFGHGAAG